MPLAPNCRLACIALSAATLIGAGIAMVPQHIRAAGAGYDVQPEAAGAGDDWCATIPPGFGHPAVDLIPLTLELRQPSVEPVSATDGRIHLPYAAQVTNTQATAIDILGVVPVDPMAGFAPTGRNLITDAQGRDVAGKVRLFAQSPDDTMPEDSPEVAPVPGFSTRVPGGNSGLMWFDVTYTDPAKIPRLLAHAMMLANAGGENDVPRLTDPVPVGCKKLAVLHPPLVGLGWAAFNGCCTLAVYHRDVIMPINGTLQGGEQFAIDFTRIGPNDTCCNGPITDVTSWWGYGAPILAAAPGVVVDAVDGMPDQMPVGTITPVPGHEPGNSVVEDIGGGRYILYAHMKPGSIPAWVRKGARLTAGVLIGRLGSSGNSGAPHLHFQVMDSPSFADSTGLPFVFDKQLLKGTVAESALSDFADGAPVTIDRTGAGVRRNQMSARDAVLGYNLSSP